MWIPPSDLRDQRKLLRLRIFLVRLRTRVTNRIHGTLSHHNVQVLGADLFGSAARLELGTRLPELPEYSREAVEQELTTLAFLETQIESAEQKKELKTCDTTGPCEAVGFSLLQADFRITPSCVIDSWRKRSPILRGNRLREFSANREQGQSWSELLPEHEHCRQRRAGLERLATACLPPRWPRLS